MRYATAGVLAALTIGFWGFVFWVSSAFGTWELASIIGGGVVVCGLWFRWELRHALADPAEAPVYVPADWEWPAEDLSSVRHGGLGR